MFEYSDTPQNRDDGLAGKRVRFSNNRIAIGGFPAKFYCRGNAEAAGVEIETVKGTKADFRAADKAMRTKLNDPKWKRPPGYTWNHAGEAGSKTTELVDTKLHGGVAHEGAASEARAELLAKSRLGKTLGVANVYMTLRQVFQDAGILNHDEIVVDEPYYFLADDGSVFVVQRPGLRDYAAGLVRPGPMWSARIVFVAGPREGKTQYITNGEYEEYQRVAEEKFGKYIPGSLFRDPRFIPGTDRSRLPYYEIDIFGVWRYAGYVDATGIHRINRRRVEGMYL